MVPRDWNDRYEANIGISLQAYYKSGPSAPESELLRRIAGKLMVRIHRIVIRPCERRSA
jgi:hypothetical protein